MWGFSDDILNFGNRRHQQLKIECTISLVILDNNILR